MVPNAENIIVTPISAHNLYARPIITDGNSQVSVSVGFKNSFGKITFDGQYGCRLEPKDLVNITKSRDLFLTVLQVENQAQGTSIVGSGEPPFLGCIL